MNAAAQRSEVEITTHIRRMEEKLPEILQNIEEIKAAALSLGEGRTSGYALASTNAADAEVRSYLEQETASISSCLRTPLAPRNKTNVVESQPDGTSSVATSTYHSAFSYMPRQNKLQALPENCTQIFVRGPTEKTHVLHVDPEWTLEDIKATLSGRTGVPTKFLFFIWGGKILPDNETLESLNIPHDATLFCNARVIGHGDGPIELWFSDGRIRKFAYDGRVSILDLKTQIRTEERILDEVQLEFHGKLLQNYETLSSSGIVRNSRIHCVVKKFQPTSWYPLDSSNGGLSDGDKLEWASPKRRRIKTAVEDWLAVGLRGWPPIRRATKIAAFRSRTQAV